MAWVRLCVGRVLRKNVGAKGPKHKVKGGFISNHMFGPGRPSSSPAPQERVGDDGVTVTNGATATHGRSPAGGVKMKVQHCMSQMHVDALCV